MTGTRWHRGVGPGQWDAGFGTGRALSQEQAAKLLLTINGPEALGR
jgi:hypothetical protein